MCVALEDMLEMVSKPCGYRWAWQTAKRVEVWRHQDMIEHIDESSKGWWEEIPR